MTYKTVLKKLSKAHKENRVVRIAYPGQHFIGKVVALTKEVDGAVSVTLENKDYALYTGEAHADEATEHELSLNSSKILFIELGEKEKD